MFSWPEKEPTEDPAPLSRVNATLQANDVEFPNATVLRQGTEMLRAIRRRKP